MPDASTTQLVVAAVSGGVAGQILSTLTRSVEFRREDRARWFEQRRVAYTGFLTAQRDLQVEGMRLALMRGLGAVPEELEHRRQDEIRAAKETARKHLDELELIAPDGVLEVGRELSKAVERFVESVAVSNLEDGGVRASGDDALKRAVDDWVADFRMRARRDLRAPRDGTLRAARRR